MLTRPQAELVAGVGTRSVYVDTPSNTYNYMELKELQHVFSVEGVMSHN